MENIVSYTIGADKIWRGKISDVLIVCSGSSLSHKLFLYPERLMIFQIAAGFYDDLKIKNCLNYSKVRHPLED